MKNIFLISLMLLGFTAPIPAQQMARGSVYEDSNKNGKKERREKGIANVSVTNGNEVVVTDASGTYELPLGDDNIIAVIKPAGYAVPLDAYNIPVFYYNYKPNGSPESKFPGVKPSGKLPKTIDFGLFRAENNKEFTALIFGDPQPYNRDEIDYFVRGVVVEVEGIENIPFGLSLGDLVGNDLDLFMPYAEAVKKVGIPWYNVMGNHDMNFDAKQDSLSDETYEAHFGPANYAFNYGKVHFIVLDDILYPDPRDDEGYYGGFREEQLNFVENDLKHVSKDKLIVLSYHIPLNEQGGDFFRGADKERLFSILKEFPHTLSLSAHTHIQKQDYFGKADGFNREQPHHEYNVGTTSGDWYSGKLDENGIPISVMRDGTPKGYAFLHFNGNQYKTEYKVAGKPKEYQMKIFVPQVVAQGRNTKAGIYADFFMGQPGDEVLYSVDNGKWESMAYVEEADPSYVALVYEWDTSDKLMAGRRSSNPIVSTHLWRGDIPAKLEPGEHKIEIKATDHYGQNYTGTASYRLEKPKK
ncbi:calcineurin-like phosphoesterase C-terminal domain-containing protein [Flavimarina sp. Hel_I_48]|uniref:calcineurin-like phosphoesterase C-terminal domain-containing protein n=1 Tax=Flavimarina sp. Hel_I_48 TaxID=1392488 RepID=UPI0004DEF8F1|nr:calcineurin-like phosphoesterase family protein [Flavimarina sp. Hel_I_48]